MNRLMILTLVLATSGGAAAVAQAPAAANKTVAAPSADKAKLHAMHEREAVQNDKTLAEHAAARGDKKGASAFYAKAQETKRSDEKTDMMRYREGYQNDERMAQHAAARGDKKGAAEWTAKAKKDRGIKPIPIDTTH